MYLYKKYVAIFAFLFLGGTICAQVIGSKFRAFSYGELMAPLLQAQQAYNETMTSINDLYDEIVEVLGHDMDTQLRQELNQELKLLDDVAKKLSETGNIGNARNGCNTIRRNVQKEIANYNNRVAQERERRARQEAEERAKVEQNRTKPQNWSGTGFALNNGYIATNYHVVEDAKSIKVKGIKGNFNAEYNATVISTDKFNDLAIIKINDSRFNGFGTIPYRVKTSMSDVGEDVFVLGYPLTTTMGDEIKLTTGVISSKTGFQGDVSLYQTSAPIQPGNSGGPLFDGNGNLIGIVNAKHSGAENVSYAIKASYLKNLVESASTIPMLPTNNMVSGMSLSNKVKNLKNFVFMITCSNSNGTTSLYSGNGSPSSTNTINNPFVRSTTASRAKIKSVTLGHDYTAIEITSNNQSGSGYYQWCNIDRNTYIMVNGTRYTMTKAEGIKIAPDKTYFSYAGQNVTFTLYFPPISSSATSMDLIESSDSEWKFYGIKIR